MTRHSRVRFVFACGQSLDRTVSWSPGGSIVVPRCPCGGLCTLVQRFAVEDPQPARLPGGAH